MYAKQLNISAVYIRHQAEQGTVNKTNCNAKQQNCGAEISSCINIHLYKNVLKYIRKYGFLRGLWKITSYKCLYKFLDNNGSNYFPKLNVEAQANSRQNCWAAV